MFRSTFSIRRLNLLFSKSFSQKTSDLICRYNNEKNILQTSRTVKFNDIFSDTYFSVEHIEKEAKDNDYVEEGTIIGRIDGDKMSVDIRTPHSGHILWDKNTDRIQEMGCNDHLFTISSNTVNSTNTSNTYYQEIIDEYKNMPKYIFNPVVSYNYATYLLEQGISGSIIIFKNLIDQMHTEYYKTVNRKKLIFYSFFNYGVSLQESGDEQAALAAYKTCLKYGNNIHLYNALAGLNLSLNYTDTTHTEAIKYIDFALKINQNDPVSNYYMAIILTTTQNASTKNIYTHFEKAIHGIKDNDLLVLKISGQYFDWLNSINNYKLNSGKCYIPKIQTIMPYIDKIPKETLQLNKNVIKTIDNMIIYNPVYKLNCVHEVKKCISDAPSQSIVILSGAGLSKEAGYPTRKDLWNVFDKDESVHQAKFIENPENLWNVVRQFYKKASHKDTTKPKPNNPYTLLEKLYSNNKVITCITQNVEGLHKEPKIELHGTLNELICPVCFTVFDVPSSKYIESKSPTCSGGTVLKPRVVLFGESVPKQKIIDSKNAIDKARIMLIIGTASDVSPAADLIRYAKVKGLILIEINETPTRITPIVDHLLQMSALDALTQITVSEV